MKLNDNVQFELGIARRWFLDGNISRAWLHLGLAKYYFSEQLKKSLRSFIQKGELIRIGWHWRWSITWRWLFIVKVHDPGVLLGYHRFNSLFVWNTRWLDFSFKLQDNIPRHKKDSLYNKN